MRFPTKIRAVYILAALTCGSVNGIIAYQERHPAESGEPLQMRPEEPPVYTVKGTEKKTDFLTYLRKNFKKIRRKYNTFITKLELYQQLRKLEETQNE